MKHLAQTAALVVALAIVGGGSADARTYDVFACLDAPNATNNSWVVSNNAPSKLESGNACGNQSGTYDGLFVRDVLATTNTMPGASAQWTFAAPEGTSVAGLSYSRWFFKNDDDDWRPGLSADGVVVDTCGITYPAVSCSRGTQGGQRTSVTLSGVKTLSAGVSCEPNPANACGGGGTLHAAVAVLYGATVTLSDSSPPSLSNVSGSLLGAGYVRGTQTASFDASDNAGIRSARLYVDGAFAAGSNYSCDFTFAVPCANKSGAQLSLDTTALSDGEHSVQVAALDPAGNEAKSASKTIVVDNTAPDAPQGLAVEGGDAWRSSNSFSATWTDPAGQVAPLAGIHSQLCPADGSACEPEQRIPGTGGSRIDGISVPTMGEWVLRVWLEDAAGNVDPTHAATAFLRYGTAPATSQPTQPGPAPDPETSADTPADPGVITSSPTTGLLQIGVTRLDPRLHLTSARLSRGRVILRGRLASGATARFTVTIRRAHARTLRRTVALKGGRFAVAIPVRRLKHGRATIAAAFAGNSFFRPARAILRARL